MFLIPTAFVILCVASAIADSPLSGLDDDQRAMMKMLRDACLKESSADEALILRAMKGDFVDDDSIMVYMACTFQQVGAMDDAGLPDLDTMISMLPESMQDRGGKMIRACKGVAGSSGPDTAMKLNKCFYNADPEYFFII